MTTALRSWLPSADLPIDFSILLFRKGVVTRHRARVKCRRGLVLMAGLTAAGVRPAGASTVEIESKVEATIPVDGLWLEAIYMAPRPAMTPDGARIYVTNVSSQRTTIIDTTNSVARTVGVGAGASGVAITPDGLRTYVATVAADRVSVPNAVTDRVEATVAMGNSPLGVAITPESTPAEDASDLIDTVDDFDRPHGLTNALKAELQAALDAIEDGDFATACSELDAFLNQVAAQSVKKLTPAQAQLTALTTQLQADIGCP